MTFGPPWPSAWQFQQTIPLPLRKVRHLRTADSSQLHFAPTSSSWLNLGERFFRDLTE